MLEFNFSLFKRVQNAGKVNAYEFRFEQKSPKLFDNERTEALNEALMHQMQRARRKIEKLKYRNFEQ